jgi:serine/threonine protein kinase
MTCNSGCASAAQAQWCRFCLGEDRPVDALPRGTTVGSYAVGRILGQGGFGITYLAKHTLLPKWVAVKEFFPDYLVRRDASGTTVRPKTAGASTEYGQVLERFLAEAQRIAQLRHRHVVEVTDFLAAHGTAYLVMPFYAGETLDALHQARARQAGSRSAKLVWSLPEVLAFARPLISAVQYLHDRTPPLLHRDIKPGNLFLAQDEAGPRLLLLDFGAAREAVDQTHVTRIWTPGFAPPEQVDGVRQTPATDAYAVAATLYWLLTSVVPADSRKRLLSDDPRSTGLVPPAMLGIDVPKAMEEALLRGLALKAQDRPPLASLLQAIEDAVTPPNRPHPARSEPASGTMRERTMQEAKASEASGARNTSDSNESTPISSRGTRWRVPMYVAGLSIFALLAWGISKSDALTSAVRTNPADSAQADSRDEGKSSRCSLGTAQSCTSLGKKYFEGDGVAKDDARALDLSLQGCDAGDAEGCTAVGVQYGNGTQAVTRDRVRANVFFKQGCDGGDPVGCTNLGVLHNSGDEAIAYEVRAVKLYEQGCDNGVLLACADAGVRYENGYGVPSNRDKALALYSKACSGTVAGACEEVKRLEAEIAASSRRTNTPSRPARAPSNPEPRQQPLRRQRTDAEIRTSMQEDLDNGRYEDAAAYVKKSTDGSQQASLLAELRRICAADRGTRCPF